MKYKEELKELGFEQYPDSDMWYYDYSDFESLDFIPEEYTRPDGRVVLKIGDLKLQNYTYDEIYFQINYELYFNDINEFLDLLRLLGYELNVKNI